MDPSLHSDAPPEADVADAADAAITCDGKGRIVDLTPAAEQLFGVSLADARGRSAMELFVPKPLREPLVRALARVTTAPKAPLRDRTVALEAIRAGGAQFPVEVVVARTSQQPVRLTAWVTELTERRAARAATLRSETLLAQAEEVGGIGSWEWVPEEDRVAWSDNLCRIAGFEPGTFTPTADLWFEGIHPEDRERTQASVQKLLEDDAFPPIEFRLIRPDGEVRHIRSTMALVERTASGARKFVGSVQDITEQRRAEREIAAHVAVAEALAGWESFETGVTLLLCNLAEAMDFDAGVLWVPRDELLRPECVWQSPALQVDVGATKAPLSFPIGSGLPGLAWQLAEPVVAPPRPREEAPGEGECTLRAVLAFPALHADEVLAVLEFHSRDRPELTERLVRSLTGISYELGGFLSRRRGELSPGALTPRELSVLQLAARGLSGPRIAAELGLSPATIKTHFEHIYEKLGVGDRGGAIAEALRLGLIR